MTTRCVYSLFQVVTFPNSECTGTNGDKGTCLSRSECQGRSGSISGDSVVFASRFII